MNSALFGGYRSELLNDNSAHGDSIHVRGFDTASIHYWDELIIAEERRCGRIFKPMMSRIGTPSQARPNRF